VRALLRCEPLIEFSVGDVPLAVGRPEPREDFSERAFRMEEILNERGVGRLLEALGDVGGD
jgi:hypothetical protein